MSEAAVSDAVQAMHEINACYQDIEIVLGDDTLSEGAKLLRILDINKKIGEITKEWI